MATFLSIIFISYSKPVSWLSSFLPLPRVLSFPAYHRRAISRGRIPERDDAGWTSPTGSFRYEAHQMRCFHYPRHDIRIALHGESQLIECLSILHVQYPSALLIYCIDANVHQILTVSMPGLHIRNQLQSHSPPTSPSSRYDRTHRSHKQQLKFHFPFTITRAYS